MVSDNGVLPTDLVPMRLWPLMGELARAAIALSRLISRNGLDGALGASAGTNTDGDTQKALDVIADDLFLIAARKGGVRHFASEEQDEVGH